VAGSQWHSGEMDHRHSVARPPVPDVLRPFVDPSGRLVQVPRREEKRVAALSWVAHSLPHGLELSEVELNSLLREFHDDVAMLRRYLVDYALVQRPEAGRYRIPPHDQDHATPAG
jgi:hypothetical protein